MSIRVVFDTNTLVSALLFQNGRLAWLRSHWRSAACVPLASRETIAELIRVLAYPKFRLTPEDRLDVLSDYLPCCETLKIMTACPILCRDPADQIFLDLAESGKAKLLVTGDDDLLSLAGQTSFAIEGAENYKSRILHA